MNARTQVAESFEAWQKRWPDLDRSDVSPTASFEGDGNSLRITSPGTDDASVNLSVSQEELRQFEFTYPELDMAGMANPLDNALKRIDSANSESDSTAIAKQHMTPKDDGRCSIAGDLENFHARFPGIDLGSIGGAAYNNQTFHRNSMVSSSLATGDTASTQVGPRVADLPTPPLTPLAHKADSEQPTMSANLQGPPEHIPVFFSPDKGTRTPIDDNSQSVFTVTPVSTPAVTPFDLRSEVSLFFEETSLPGSADECDARIRTPFLGSLENRFATKQKAGDLALPLDHGLPRWQRGATIPADFDAETSLQDDALTKFLEDTFKGWSDEPTKAMGDSLVSFGRSALRLTSSSLTSSGKLSQRGAGQRGSSKRNEGRRWYQFQHAALKRPSKVVRAGLKCVPLFSKSARAKELKVKKGWKVLLP